MRKGLRTGILALALWTFTSCPTEKWSLLDRINPGKEQIVTQTPCP